MDVLLLVWLSYLDNPKIKCMKQLFNETARKHRDGVVSLAVKKTQGIQRFKLPFKNLSTYLDSDIEFAFIRTQVKDPAPKRAWLRGPHRLSEFRFYCQPQPN